MYRGPEVKRAIPALALVAAAAFLLAGCTPDVTRERLEADVASTYSHVYDLNRYYRGDDPVHLQPTAECHRSGQHPSGDQGPGSWGCELKYTDPSTGKKGDVFEVILMGGDTCYQGLNPDLNDHPTVHDVHTNGSAPNPLFQFDGCLDVYNDKTS